jgi:GTPase SAR1 family protein
MEATVAREANEIQLFFLGPVGVGKSALIRQVRYPIISS